MVLDVNSNSDEAIVKEIVNADSRENDVSQQATVTNEAGGTSNVDSAYAVVPSSPSSPPLYPESLGPVDASDLGSLEPREPSAQLGRTMQQRRGRNGRPAVRKTVDVSSVSVAKNVNDVARPDGAAVAMSSSVNAGEESLFDSVGHVMRSINTWIMNNNGTVARPNQARNQLEKISVTKKKRAAPQQPIVEEQRGTGKESSSNNTGNEVSLVATSSSSPPSSSDTSSSHSATDMTTPTKSRKRKAAATESTAESVPSNVENPQTSLPTKRAKRALSSSSMLLPIDRSPPDEVEQSSLSAVARRKRKSNVVDRANKMSHEGEKAKARKKSRKIGDGESERKEESERKDESERKEESDERKPSESSVRQESTDSVASCKRKKKRARRASSNNNNSTTGNNINKNIVPACPIDPPIVVAEVTSATSASGRDEVGCCAIPKPHHQSQRGGSRLVRLQRCCDEKIAQFEICDNRPPKKRPGLSLLKLGIRAMQPRALLPGESCVISGNVCCEPNMLHNVEVSVYGDETNVHVSPAGSLIDRDVGGLSVYLVNVSSSFHQINVGDIFGYVQLRSLDGALKLNVQ